MVKTYENLLEENERMSSCMKDMNALMALKILQVNQLVKERDSLKRRIAYLEQKIEGL
ncbi:hypothetical protein [Abiotrophia defectiva]|jgi:hypothetical protein|uniref:hypothetical protein n=1 Tax=Abiotrophia defectiva TaxID=46125 RepID=UPI00205D541E|nr:hypothetical protein [Abiotrophia defectiva]DAX60554.1 MAG TPA: Receptor recognition protein, Long tail, Helical sandwich, Tail fiber [Caudoviricetes sp.]